MIHNLIFLRIRTESSKKKKKEILALTFIYAHSRHIRENEEDENNHLPSLDKFR